MKNKKLLLVALLTLTLLCGVVAVVGEELSGNEILTRVDQEAQFLSEGSMITTLQFEIEHGDGTTSAKCFGSLSKQVKGGAEYSLIYFVSPEDEEGTIFLSVKPDPDEDSRMWLYLPALGMVKELVAEQQEQSFAGSTFSYQDVGSRDMKDEYDAELIGEETLVVGDESRLVYVLALTARPDAEVDYPTAKMWIDKEGFFMLRTENYNAAGNLEWMMEVTKLGEFEGKVTADQMIASNVLDESSTTITFLTRVRPEGELSDSVFDSENLASFDPAIYGL
jgi:hypothetical protein